MKVDITRTFLFGLLLIVFSGFLTIYSVLKGHLYVLEGTGAFMLIVGLIIGILGLVIPEEKMRDVWISMGMASGIGTLFVLFLSVSPNVAPAIGTFPITFIITFVVTYLALKLRNKGKTIISLEA